jgi:hypothetical protein
MDATRVERVSTCEHEYDGKKLVAGERFSVEPKHVGLLLLLGRIAPQEGEPGYVPELEDDLPVPAKARRNGRTHRL